MENTNDLLDTPELIPEEVQAVLDDIQDDNWDELEKARIGVEKLGYTFDYDFSMSMYNLRKIIAE